jgi:hypothetical protein
MAGSTLVANALYIVGTLAVASYQQRKARQKARDEHNAAQVDRMLNVSSSVMGRELVLGRVRKAGGVYFRGSEGIYKQNFLMHLALASHEIDAVEQIYFNDTPVLLDENGYVYTAPYAVSETDSLVGGVLRPGETSVTISGNASGIQLQYPLPFTTSFDGINTTVDFPGAPYTRVVSIYCQSVIAVPYARVWWSLGGEDHAADPITKQMFPDLWTDAHRARGVATLYCLFVYSETAFPSGLPAVSARIRGAKVYDPRTSTTAWSENPALLARHVYQHPHFGKATVSAAEDARFMAAANACDTSHNYVVDGVSNTHALYRAGVVAPYGTPARSLLDDLAQAMGGAWALSAGELYIRAGVYTAPVMTLTDADLAVIQRDGDSAQQSPVSISVHQERAQKFNTVNLRIWDDGQDYKMVALSPVRSTALIARDGAELAQEIAMPAVSYAPQAQHAAGILMRDARDPLTFEAPWKLRAYPLEIFDTVEVTLARYGWSSKTFMVLARQWDRARGVIQLTLKETSAAIYTPDASFSPQGYARNTALPVPAELLPPALSAQAVYSGTAQLVAQPGGTYMTRVLVEWPAMPDVSVTEGGHIEVQWCLAEPELDWQSIIVSGGSNGCYIIGPEDGQRIIIRARARNSIAWSDWCVQIAHDVVGKTEPPEAPTNVSVSPDYVLFTPTEDIDIAGYRILYNVGTSTNRSIANQLHTGLVAGSPWPLPIRLYGTNTIIVVSVDTSGNESAASTDTQDLGQPDAANIAHVVDYAADGFTGAKTSCSVSGGVLVADADPNLDIYGLGSGSDIYYRDGFGDIYGGDQFVSMAYVDRYASPYSNGTILLDLETTGSRVDVQYRPDGDAFGDVYSDADRADIYGDYSGIYGDEQNWRMWPGYILDAVEALGYQFRVSVGYGSLQGAITAMAARTELPQISQNFGAVAISSAGTVISPADGLSPIDFIAIEDVQITPIGGAAVSGRVKSYPIDPAVGPTVELINSLGVPVDGDAFVRLSGY